MPHFKAAPGSLADLDYTPRFFCQLCGCGAPAEALSEIGTRSGAVRELLCPGCGALERVGIHLNEQCSGWALFHAEEELPAETGAETVG